MKDQHRLARLLKELEVAFVVETPQLQQAFALLKQLDRRERRRLLERFEQLVGRSKIEIVMPRRRMGSAASPAGSVAPALVATASRDQFTWG